MRYLALALVVSFGCGGGSQNATSDHPQGGGGTQGAADAGPATTTTTTVLMGDAGELQGTKLTTTQAPATLDGGSTAAPQLNPNQHDTGRTREDIMTIINTHRPEARACYDAALKNNPGLGEGFVDITWKLDPQGKVVETGVNDATSQIHDAGIVKCIGDVIRSIRWAPSPRGVETTMHYPYNFHPHGRGNP